MGEIKLFTLRQLAPIFEDAADCAGNVVMPVGIGQQDEELIAAVLRNNIAAPQRAVQTLHKFFAALLERNAFIVARPFEREKHNANRFAVTCAGALEKTINDSETLKGNDICAGFFIAFGKNHFNLRERDNCLDVFFGRLFAENVVTVLAVLLDNVKCLVSFFVKLFEIGTGLRNEDATD